ncbi:energy-coupling factor ABC transporter substrate-binding protein [Bacillus weihaiensis]|uniref:Cobalt transport protein CbiN n=1 Tax=Bacillus weihaiensis TaxID=1547283 RepID=A0A1L3MRW5_9BACI|nr:energy-coupling factor ABC transporter substrate-binding protein [Bacillus weihaiensis]APH05079.1 cobalt ABC transporter substrate-binding protein CbiN [Bacillus weihaiensis]
MKNLVMFFFVVILAVVPLFIHKDTDFGGADGQAEKAITEIAPDYEPWFSSFWEPPGGETESLLFSLQAALGAIFIGYFFGFGRARRKYSSKQ